MEKSFLTKQKLFDTFEKFKTPSKPKKIILQQVKKSKIKYFMGKKQAASGWVLKMKKIWAFPLASINFHG